LTGRRWSKINELALKKGTALDCEVAKMELDPVTGVLRFDPAEFGLNLSWEDFQSELVTEFNRYNDDLLRGVDTSPEAPDEYAALSVLELLLSPGDAIALCDKFRERLQCPLPDPMILRILWQNRDVIDAAQNSQN
jgi:hypothetical protein